MAAAPNPALQSQAYLKTKVLTASPAELRLLLLDGAIRFAEQTKAGYAAKDYEKSFDGTTKCQAILTELLCSLRHDVSPELCSRLSALYTFLYRRMLDASTNKSPEIVEEVLGLLRYERETWSMLLEQLSRNGSAPSGQNDSKALSPSAGTLPPPIEPGTTHRMSLQA
ncbi:MAG: flagellar export chaperone FliS [Phycisphaerae bacterium]|nr:flagellar export chaperone FliS [Phycisphaerae bacterium]